MSFKFSVCVFETLRETQFNGHYKYGGRSGGATWEVVSWGFDKTCEMSGTGNPSLSNVPVPSSVQTNHVVAENVEFALHIRIRSKEDIPASCGVEVTYKGNTLVGLFTFLMYQRT